MPKAEPDKPKLCGLDKDHMTFHWEYAEKINANLFDLEARILQLEKQMQATEKERGEE